MPTPRHLLRAAVRLSDLYRDRAAHAVEQAFLKRLADLPPATQSACVLLRQAATAERCAGTQPLRRQLHRLVQVLRYAVTQTAHQLGRPRSSCPSDNGLFPYLPPVW